MRQQACVRGGWFTTTRASARRSHRVRHKVGHEHIQKVVHQRLPINATQWVNVRSGASFSLGNGAVDHPLHDDVKRGKLLFTHARTAGSRRHHVRQALVGASPPPRGHVRACPTWMKGLTTNWRNCVSSSACGVATGSGAGAW